MSTLENRIHTSSMASLTPPPPHSSWLRMGKNIFAGFLVALVTITYSVSYAALIFPGQLSTYLGFGVGCALVSAAIIGCWVAWTSSLPFAVAGPDSNAAAFLALIVSSVAAMLQLKHPGVPMWPTLLATIVVSTLISGFLLFLLGFLRLGRLVRFIPYPVVGGFLGGTGWLITVGALTVMMGKTPDISEFTSWFTMKPMLQWLPGVMVALVLLLVLRQFQHFLMMPLLLIGFIVIFHLTLWFSGWSLDQARTSGLLFEAFPNGQWMRAWKAFSLKDVQWMLLFEQSSGMLAMTAVVCVTILLNATGLELATMRDVELDQELRSAGAANLFAGFAGGLCGYLSISRSLLNHMAGASGRVAGFLSAFFCGVIAFWGLELLLYLPKPILGGVLLYLGLSLLMEWLVDSWARLSRFDYFLVVLIVVIIAVRGFLSGVLFGVVAACLIFAFSYSRIRVIKHEFTGLERQSNVERTLSLQNALEEHADQIYVLILQGYIFFGTAAALLERVRERIEKPGEQPKVRFLVLDFRLVSAVDSSAIIGFVKMRQLAYSSGITLIYSHLPPKVEEILKNNGCLGGDSITYSFQDLDRSIEWCEEFILQVDDFTRSVQLSFMDMLEEQFPSKEPLERLLPYLEPTTLEAGEYLFREGDPSDGLYFLDRGRISVLLEVPGGRCKRLLTMGSGTVVGEMGLYLESNRSASVVAEQNSQLYRLSVESMKKLQQEDPALASNIHHFIVRMLATRLAHANRELSAFQHHH